MASPAERKILLRALTEAFRKCKPLDPSDYVFRNAPEPIMTRPIDETDGDEKLDFLRETAPDAYEFHQTIVLPENAAARWEMLCDLYAPMDEDGKRQPGDGLISREDFMRLADIVTIKLT